MIRQSEYHLALSGVDQLLGCRADEGGVRGGEPGVHAVPVVAAERKQTLAHDLGDRSCHLGAILLLAIALAWGEFRSAGMVSSNFGRRVRDSGAACRFALAAQDGARLAHALEQVFKHVFMHGDVLQAFAQDRGCRSCEHAASSDRPR